MKKVVTVTACPGYQKCRPVTITKKKYLGAKTVTEEVPAEEETTTTVQAEKTSTGGRAQLLDILCSSLTTCRVRSRSVESHQH